MKNTPLATGLTLEIDNLTSDGEGVARRNRDVYFVPGALPGETVEVMLDGRRRQVWQTKLKRIINVSPERVPPICPHYERCGGCDVQHLAYDGQIRFKQQRVEREFQRQGIEVGEWVPPLLSEPWHYRRKARVGVRFSKEQGNNFVGFREAASTHLTNIDQCQVLPKHEALNWAQWRERINQLNGRAHISQIEVIVADNALALVFRVLKPLQPQDQAKLVDWVSGFTETLPVQLWVKLEKGSAPVCIWPSQAEPLHHIVDQMPLVIQPDDFVQVNAQVNRDMVQQALSWLEPTSEMLVWDLFAGHGNFSMPLAQRSQKVYAVEGDAAMVASLERQAHQLGLALQASVADLNSEAGLATLPTPDAVLLDPPRAGAPGIMSALIARQVPRIVYVACDPATLARDVKVLTEAGYRVMKAGIMDMFPQTHHVESMVLLQRKAKRNG